MSSHMEEEKAKIRSELIKVDTMIYGFTIGHKLSPIEKKQINLAKDYLSKAFMTFSETMIDYGMKE